MEYKATGQNVAINEVVFNECVEQPVDSDFTLPDYCPDITRILKCRVVPRIHSKNASGATLTVEGAAHIQLLYTENESDRIYSFEQAVNFTKSVEMGVDVESAVIGVRFKTEYVNCRAITQRKVDVHGAISMAILAYKGKNTEIITDIDGGGAQMLRGSVDATSTIGTAEKFLVIDDEIELESGAEAIGTIIRADARAVTSDNKIISNKVIVKGELLLNALYIGEEDGTPQTIESSIPISQIIDIDGINEQCNCSVALDVVSLDLKPRTGLSGEARSVSVSVKICAQVKAYCHSEIPVLYEAYSTSYEIDCKKNDLPFEKLINEINEIYLCKKTLDLPDEAIDSVVDLWCESHVATAKVEGNQVVVPGSVLICMLVKDGEGKPSYLERPVDFEYRYNLESTPGEIRCDPQVVALASSYSTPSEGKLEAKVELEITAEVFEKKRISVITEVTIDEESPKSKEKRAALMIYFAQPGEKVWDIARRYNTSMEEVNELNELDGEQIKDKKMLLIPSL